MDNWNRTGKIKAICLGLMALPNLILPPGQQAEQGPEMIVMPLIFGIIAIPLIAKFNSVFLYGRITKPSWNDNPFTLKHPLSFFHFSAFFFVTVGLSVLFGAGIKFQTVNFIGCTSVSLGLGMLAGIWLTLRWAKSTI